MRSFFEGDFYPLTDLRAADSQGERAWCAYQMHRPDLDAGFVLCFRRIDAPSYLFTATLGGIDPSARYTVETYGAATEQVDGRAFANFTADLRSPRSFKLVFYARVR
jgi:alpha-galactosidase